MADLLKVNPTFTRKLAKRRLFYFEDPKQIAIYIEGLRRAGVRGG